MVTSWLFLARELHLIAANYLLLATSATVLGSCGGGNVRLRSLCVLVVPLLLAASAHAGPIVLQPIDLGNAASFAVLAGSTVTNTGASVITGNLGVSPGLSVTGFPPGLVNGGTIHAGDAVALAAQTSLVIAYNAAAGLAPNSNLTGQDLGGLTLTPGVYFFQSSAQLTGTLTLNALGDPNAVFVFQIGSTLTTASNSSVIFTNGGVGNNLFWQVGSSATLGTTTSFTGNILALTSITLNTGANINCGRALAQNGAVTLDTNRVTIGPCANAPGAVPEPSTLILLATGVIGTVGLLRRRR